MGQPVIVSSGEGPVGVGFVCRQRLVAEDGTGELIAEEGNAVAADDVAGTVGFKLYDLGSAAPDEPIDENDLNPDAVFVDLVNDDWWTKDDVGYNFRHAVDDALIVEPHLHRAVFDVVTSGGTTFRWASPTWRGSSRSTRRSS
jgi:hypothetical protein